MTISCDFDSEALIGPTRGLRPPDPQAPAEGKQIQRSFLHSISLARGHLAVGSWHLQTGSWQLVVGTYGR
jgi:hypothetical protein